MIVKLLTAPWLDGRSFECFIAVVLIVYGALLIAIPGAAAIGDATADLAWLGRWLGLPVFVAGWLIAAGVTCDVVRWSLSARRLRRAGAASAWLILAWFTWKLLLIDVFPTIGFSCCAVGLFFLIRVFAMAGAELPRNGRH